MKQTKERFLAIYVILSMMVAIFMVALSANACSILIDKTLVLYPEGMGAYHRVYSTPYEISDAFKNYEIELSELDSAILLIVTGENNLKNYHNIVDEEFTLQLNGKFKSIELTDVTEQNRFHVKITGIRYNTLGIYIISSLVYLLFSIFFILQIRNAPSNDEKRPVL